MKKFVGLFLSLALMVSATAVTASASEHHAFSEAETEELRAQITAQAVVDSVNASLDRSLVMTQPIFPASMSAIIRWKAGRLKLRPV